MRVGNRGGHFVRTLVIVNTRCYGGDVNLYDYLRTLAPSSAEVVRALPSGRDLLR